MPREMKHQRLLAVEALQERIVSAKNMRLRGRTLDVLVEGQKNGKWWGRIRTDRVTFLQRSPRKSCRPDSARPDRRYNGVFAARHGSRVNFTRLSACPTLETYICRAERA